MIDEAAPADETSEIAERNLRVLEALLFASADPLSPEAMQPYLGEGADVPALLAELAERYRGRGVNLVRRGAFWAFRTADDLALMLRREETESRQLSRAALEVILRRGPLARRILGAAGGDTSLARLPEVYRQLCDDLSAGRMFNAHV